MAVFAFEKNLGFSIDGVDYILRRKFDADHWQFEEVKTGRYHERSDAALRVLYASGQLRPHTRAGGVALGGATPHREVAEEKVGQAKVRRAYAVEALKGPLTQVLLEDVASRVWERIKQPAAQPHWITVYRWAKKLLLAGNDVYGLVDQDDKRGNRTQRYPQEVTEAIEQAIDTVYLKLEGGSIQDVLDRAIVDIGRENGRRLSSDQLPLPTRRLVKRLIDQIPAFERCVARHGREYAVRKFRAVNRHRVTDAPLERAEIDHSPLDLMVVDDKSGLPLGRPYVTACIDDHTRSVLGIWIGFEPPSYLTVARCLRHAFMPKCDLRQRYPSITNEWAAHGVMRELSMATPMLALTATVLP
jgi:putative transposase